jgi:hypothetical protein
MTESDDYTIGYRKPPRHSQFKKGQSGNPGGRRRSLAANAHSALSSVLARRVTVDGEEGEARMSQLEALMADLVKKARGGDTRCMKLVLDRLSELEANGPAQRELESLSQKAAREEAGGQGGTAVEMPDPPPAEN